MRRLALLTCALIAACGHETVLHTPEPSLVVQPAVIALDPADGRCTTSDLFVWGDAVLTGMWLEPTSGDLATLSWPAIHTASVADGVLLALRYCSGPEPLAGTLVLTFRSGEVRTVWVGESE